MKRRLYLFTATYPFEATEPFLEDEIGYLCHEFDQVVITPLYGSRLSRQVPDNCVVNTPILSPSKVKQCLAALLPGRAFKHYAKEFFAKRVWSSAQRLKCWLISYIHTCNIIHSRCVQGILKDATAHDTLYFYWGKGSNVLPLLYPGEYTSVCRFHGEWDLWEESCGDYAPLRKAIAEKLDLAIFISERGEQYYSEKYPSNPTAVSRLGARDCGLTTRSSDGTLRILSCSSVYPLKRVPLILEAVKQIEGRNVEWTHIGAGADFDTLKSLADQSKTPHLTINLMGQMSHDDVMEYYRNHCVDLFINLSTNEGIPVTIMEAISFGVPVVATNVGSTSEIVNDLTGTLLAADPSIQEITSAIEQTTTKPTNPRAFWAQYYNAESNYSAFARLIKSTKQR